MEAIANPISDKLRVVQLVPDASHLLQPPVVSIEKHKEHINQLETKPKKELPLFWNEPIFKPKDYDPL